MKTITHGLLPFAAICFTVPAFTQALDRQYSLEIERQSLASALAEFSKQTGLQIERTAETLTDGIFIGPLSGRYTADTAIAQLLLPSGLSFERLNEGTIAVTGREPTRSKRRDFSTMQGTGNDHSAPSFVRLENVNLAEGTAGDEDDQKVKIAASTAESDDSKRKRLSGALEEVIVTAQKREEKLLDVPISISVLSGAVLDQSSVAGVTEAISRIPSVSTTIGSAGNNSSISIRGIPGGAIFAGGSTVAYYLETVPFGLVKSGFAPDASAYDLERVEVLRGPQGTLYGSSALNGVVRVLTKDANLEEWEFKGRTSVSDTKGGGESYRGDVAVNVPIVEGKLAARAVVGYQDLGGWIDKPVENDVNDGEIGTMRLKINAQPSENLTVDMFGWLSRTDYGAPSMGDSNGQRNAVLAVGGNEPISTDYDAYGLKIGYDFPSFSVQSMTSYLDFANRGKLDSTATNPALPSSGRILNTAFDSEVLSQEVLFSSLHDELWRWSVGGMARRAEERMFQLRATYLAPTDQRDLSKSFAVFGELTRILLNSRLELTGGLRYFEDDVGFNEVSRLTGVPATQLAQRTDKYDALSPRVVLTWHPSDQMTIYASYAEGFRSGAGQQPAVTAAFPGFQPAGPDTLTNYELGLKSALWGGRVNLDTSLYYIDWEDIQTTIGVVLPGGTLFNANVNGDSAGGMGFDFSATIRPVDRVELGVNFGWNDLTYDTNTFAGPVLITAKGDHIAGSPEYTAGGWVDYAFPFGRNGFEGRFSTSANYTSELVPARFVAAFRPDPILIARASFSIDAPRHWKATLFVDNLNNEDGAVLIDQRSPEWTTRVRPRTVGVQFEYQY